MSTFNVLNSSWLVWTANSRVFLKAYFHCFTKFMMNMFLLILKTTLRQAENIYSNVYCYDAAERIMQLEF